MAHIDLVEIRIRSHPGKLLKPAHRLGRIKGCLLDCVQTFLEPWILYTIQSQLRPTQNDGQDVVEVMGHPSRHLTQRPELLRPHHIILGHVQLLVSSLRLLVSSLRLLIK